MQLATSAAAVPAIAFIGTTPAIAEPVQRTAWDRAVACLRDAEAKHDGISGQGDALADEAEAACPRRDEFFRRYHLGCGWSRERNVAAARQAIIIEGFADRTPLGRMLSADEKDDATTAANCIVDEFDAWHRQHLAAWREYDAWEKLFDAAVAEREEARKHVLELSAPDSQALLFKIELLSRVMDEASVKDADSMAHIQDDARRLLASGRA